MRAYSAAGMQHLVLNASTQESPAAMIETIEYFASEVRPRLAG